MIYFIGGSILLVIFVSWAAVALVNINKVEETYGEDIPESTGNHIYCMSDEIADSYMNEDKEPRTNMTTPSEQEILDGKFDE